QRRDDPSSVRRDRTRPRHRTTPHGITRSRNARPRRIRTTRPLLTPPTWRTARCCTLGTRTPWPCTDHHDRDRRTTATSHESHFLFLLGSAWVAFVAVSDAARSLPRSP